MRINKFAATSALVIGSLAVAAGTANADASVNTGDQVVNYTASTTPTSAIIKTDAGSLVNENGALEIKAPNGNVIAGVPLSFKVDDFTFPVAADIQGNTATLSPKFDLADATYTPVSDAAKANLPADSTVKNIDLPFQNTAPWKTPYDREQAAWNRLKDTVSVGGTIGAAVGAVGGGLVGCVVGGAIGATTTGALAGIVTALVAFLPAGIAGAIGGCIVGAAVTGFLGTIGGALLVTIPVAIAAAVQYFTTINAPFTPPAAQ